VTMCRARHQVTPVLFLKSSRPQGAAEEPVPDEGVSELAGWGGGMGLLPESEELLNVFMRGQVGAPRAPLFEVGVPGPPL